MTTPVLICIDGSELSLLAAQAGLKVLRSGAAITLVTVISEPDPTLVTGGGFTGSTMTAEEFERENAAFRADAEALLTETQQQLGLADAARRVLMGPAGPTVCEYAVEVDAEAIVIGSRGHGGLRRAILGSVSDHIVRHAHCTVLVTSHDALGEETDGPTSSD
ncbi:MAG: universal stress protein [Microthrixaceae bacterium]